MTISANDQRADFGHAELPVEVLLIGCVECLNPRGLAALLSHLNLRVGRVYK